MRGDQSRRRSRREEDALVGSGDARVERARVQGGNRSFVGHRDEQFVPRKEVFLRELISNASDALEKRRHEAIKDAGRYGFTDAEKESEFRIKISTVEEKEEETGTSSSPSMKLIIEDNGIGMSEEELTKNLGTIAKSGSKEFLENLAGKGGGIETTKEEAASNIIGKFGVGFYSAFMVGKKVEVHTSNGNESFVWTSEGTGSLLSANRTRRQSREGRKLLFT